MNQITTALVAAGVKVPTVKQRIFNWLKDHPEKTMRDITKGLQFAYEPAQAVLDMEKAGVLKAYSDINRTTNMYVKRYSCAVATLPLGPIGPKKVYKKALPPASPAAKLEADVQRLASVNAKPVEFSPDEALRGLTVQQMHALYKHLHQYFGG